MEGVPAVAGGPEPAVVFEDGVDIRDDAIGGEVLEFGVVHAGAEVGLRGDVGAGEGAVVLEVDGVEGGAGTVADFGVDEDGGEGRVAAVGASDAAADVFEEWREIRQGGVEGGAGEGFAVAPDAVVGGLVVEVVGGGGGGDDAEAGGEGLVEVAQVAGDVVGVTGRGFFFLGPGVGDAGAEADEVGEADVFEAGDFASAGAPHDDGHLIGEGTGGELDIEGGAGGGIWRDEAGAEGVGAGLEGGVEDKGVGVRLAGGEGGEGGGFGARAEVDVEGGAGDGLAGEVGAGNLDGVGLFHAAPDGAGGGEGEFDGFELEGAVTEADVIEEAGEAAVVGAVAVGEGEGAGAGDKGAEAGMGGAAEGGAVEVEGGGAGGVVGDGEVLPLAGGEVEGIGVEGGAVAAEAEGELEAAGAGFVGLGELEGVVGVGIGGVFFVEEVAAVAFVELGLGVEPEFEGEGAGRGEAGFGGDAGLVGLIGDGKAFGGFEGTAAETFWGEGGAVQGEGIAFA